MLDIDLVLLGIVILIIGLLVTYAIKICTGNNSDNNEDDDDDNWPSSGSSVPSDC